MKLMYTKEGEAVYFGCFVCTVVLGVLMGVYTGTGLRTPVFPIAILLAIPATVFLFLTIAIIDSACEHKKKYGSLKDFEGLS